jgi:hypothetical protein
MLKVLLDFIAKNARYIRQNSKVGRVLAVWLRWLRLLVLRHVVPVSLVVLASLIVTLFFFPWVLPKSCATLEPRGEWIESSGPRRACQHGTVVALAWRITLEKIPEPRGRILLSLIATSSAEKGLWREHYASRPDDRHDWKLEGSASSNENLPLNGCDTSAPNVPLQTRSGFRLRSEPRPLGPGRDNQCYRASHLDPRFAYCGWGYLELFVESDSANWCRSKNVFDYYRADRVVTRETGRLCFRAVDMLGRPLGDGYQQIGEIQRVWCD